MTKKAVFSLLARFYPKSVTNQARLFTEIYNPVVTPWSKIRKRIMEIERLQFGKMAFYPSVLGADFTNPDHIVILLKTGNKRIIGYTYAQPTTQLYSEYYPKRSIYPHTAYISSIALHPKYMGRGLAKLLSQTLERELRTRGFTHIELDARKKFNYATTIQKVYAQRIEFMSQPYRYQYGLQMFFRIRL
ncbi:GNAT family N-acetyltransferase [Candidatus Microgenomates bacterium]|nr:MAG: GNAT family N-acetyltransferase [Candidatus Microgenomates bacterium]